MATLKMLAIDLGASSGRGMVGKFDGNKISLEEIHRFPNGPVNLNGSLYWDILRTFGEIKTALHNCAMSDNKDIKSMAIDTWGVDYGLLDKDGKLLENPYCYRDERTTKGIMEELFKVIPKEELYKMVEGTCYHVSFSGCFEGEANRPGISFTTGEPEGGFDWTPEGEKKKERDAFVSGLKGLFGKK